MASTPGKLIERLQFLTMDDAPLSPLQQAEAAVRSGIRWIQLRMKHAAGELFLETALAIKKICDEHGSVLIINDRVEIAEAVGAHGVHLGKLDMPVGEARRILGDGYIIGGTANTAADIREHRRQGADYIGLGPFRYTSTKKNLSPVLGEQGYLRIMNELGEGWEQTGGQGPGLGAQASIPIVAIGGIGAADLGPVLRAGIHGIAFSGLLLSAEDRTELVKMLSAELALHAELGINAELRLNATHDSSLSTIHYADDRR